MTNGICKEVRCEKCGYVIRTPLDYVIIAGKIVKLDNPICPKCGSKLSILV